MRRRLLLAFLLLLWLSVVGCGMALVWSYNYQAGEPAEAPAHWPKDSRIQPTSGQHTLIVMAHPKCPCTRATVEELSKLMTHTQGRLQTYVLFVKPKGTSEDWNRTDLWDSASVIPGVKVLIDDDGTEAGRFGAHVSGQTLLYDEKGSLVFRGGITESRGQVGDNAGRRAVEALVNEGAADRDQTVVFGCPLFDPDSECRKPNHATYKR